MPHDIFIDRIIDDLLQQNVTPVIIMRPIPDSPNVHARAESNMLQTRQRLNLALVVNVLACVCHTKLRVMTIVQESPNAKRKFDKVFRMLFTLNSPNAESPRGCFRVEKLKGRRR
jgi:hypothetical protein